MKTESGQIFDVSMPIHTGMPVYKNKPEKKPEFTVTSDFLEQSAHETRIHMDAHTGTHIDAPLHMIPGGDTIETLPLNRLLGHCKVYDLTTVEDAVQRSHIESLPIECGEFVLFKTKNSFDDVFNANFIYVAESAAEFLAERQVSGVGVDGLGIERSQPSHGTHRTLFNAGVIIIEGLRLANVTAGSYELLALPLALTGIDAAPARVVLREFANA